MKRKFKAATDFWSLTRLESVDGEAAFLRKGLFFEFPIAEGSFIFCWLRLAVIVFLQVIDLPAMPVPRAVDEYVPAAPEPMHLVPVSYTHLTLPTILLV